MSWASGSPSKIPTIRPPRRLSPWCLGLLLVGVLEGCVDAVPEEEPRADPPTVERGSPRLTVAGRLFFSESDIGHLRTTLENASFPVSESTISARLGFRPEDLQRGLSSLSGLLSASYVLNTECLLTVVSDPWNEESDDWLEAEVHCYEEGPHFTAPEIQATWPDRRAALQTLALTSAEVERLRRCGDPPHDVELALLECYWLDEDHKLLVQTTEDGVAVAMRRHWR